MILTVTDPDAVFRKAIAAGAREVAPVVDQEYGWRVGRVVDPFGHHWEIGKPLQLALSPSKKPPFPNFSSRNRPFTSSACVSFSATLATISFIF